MSARERVFPFLMGNTWGYAFALGLFDLWLLSSLCFLWAIVATVAWAYDHGRTSAH